MVSDSDVKRLVSALRHQQVDVAAALGEEFGYVQEPQGPVLICLDLVLSGRQHYGRVVEPRIAAFRQEWADIRSLEELKQLIATYGHEGFGTQVWRFRGRVSTLVKLVDWFLKYKSQHGLDDDLESVQHWARTWPGKRLPLRDIGEVRTRYLRMLAGVDTVAPTPPIQQFVRDAVRHDATDEEIVRLVQRAAHRLGVRPVQLDHAIWQATQR